MLVDQMKRHTSRKTSIGIESNMESCPFSPPAAEDETVTRVESVRPFCFRRRTGVGPDETSFPITFFFRSVKCGLARVVVVVAVQE